MFLVSPQASYITGAAFPSTVSFKKYLLIAR